MGHGGTLDPMATGVLILGVGSGTKSLNSFLECTKSYECVVLFGAATDSYDAVGKIVARKDYSHVTNEIVQEALGKFRGKIMQKPPIFSALKVNGKKMYEYAREGKELPIEIEERAVEVQELEMIEWMEGGTHLFNWPTEDAPQKEKEAVDKVLKLEDEGAEAGVGAKRKRVEDDAPGEKIADEDTSPSKRVRSSLEPNTSGTPPKDSAEANPAEKPEPLPQSDPSTSTLCPAPACRLKMTVTSGFYVRSLAHDLGAAVGSLALMSSLVRTRQGDFALGQNVLDYDDLGKGEEVWGSKVEGMLEDWRSKESSREGAENGGAGSGRKGRENESKRQEDQGGANHKWRENSTSVREANAKSQRRRNSSSPDSGDGD